MKLSVCIPIYNFDVRELVFELKKQILSTHSDAEIILIDDTSNSYFIEINAELSGHVTHFIKLDENIGRARIRNLFTEYASGEFLLFLDCDGKVVSDNFISDYFKFLLKNSSAEIIYGGRKVSDKTISEKHQLRWKFASERENLPVAKRILKPYLSFQTNNFVIRKQVFKKIRFNECLTQYGYEDLLFALDAREKNIKIHHIENEIFNNDIEQNEIYLKKVEESVENLALLLEKKQLNRKLSEIKLVKAYALIKSVKAQRLYLFVFLCARRYLIKNLLSKNPNLKFLDFYKLGLLLKRL